MLQCAVAEGCGGEQLEVGVTLLDVSSRGGDGVRKDGIVIKRFCLFTP